MEMTSRERILATMRGQRTDRVPFQLGLSNMFSVLQNGYRGWDVYMHGSVPMWKLVADTQRRLGLDGYLYIGAGATTPHPDVQYDGYVAYRYCLPPDDRGGGSAGTGIFPYAYDRGSGRRSCGGLRGR